MMRRLICELQTNSFLPVRDEDATAVYTDRNSVDICLYTC